MESSLTAAPHTLVTSSTHDLSPSVSSSGYYSHGWSSEISGSSQLVGSESEAVSSAPWNSAGAAADKATLADKNTHSVKAGESSTPAAKQNVPDSPELKEERILRCKYCNAQFEVGSDTTALCPSAPNKPRETIDRLCCVGCYKGAWYHMTKDSLDDEGQDIGRCSTNGMTPGYWCLLGVLSVFCSPCLLLWCPLSMCELAAQHAGITGGPHNVITVRKKTTMLPSKKRPEDSMVESIGVITEQPHESTVPLTVTVTMPDEERDMM